MIFLWAHYMDVSIRRLLARSFLWGVVFLNSSILNTYLAPPNPNTLNHPASSKTSTYSVLLVTQMRLHFSIEAAIDHPLQ